MSPDKREERDLSRFKGTRVLVTGGAGFIGSHLTEHLVKIGAKVLVIDDMSNGPPKNLDAVRDSIALSVGSVVDREFVRAAVKKHEPEIVFHLAARNLVLSIRNPGDDAQVTIIGLLNLLDAIRETDRTEVFVHSSTGSVYGEPVESPQTEKHSRVPTSPYGVSKMAAEEYLRVWNKLYSTQYVALRYYNVYGPRQSANESTGGGVIPVFANRLLAGQPLIVDGTGKQQRCFTYVSDVARSNLLSAINKKCWCNFYNIATNERMDILSLAKLMMEVSGVKVPIQFGPERPGDIMRFDPSIELAAQKMGYAPKVTLRNGLISYFDWLRSSRPH
jgi:UDP-glucose 4-epimerase